MTAAQTRPGRLGSWSAWRRSRVADGRPTVLAKRQHLVLVVFVVAVGTLAPLILTSRSERYLTNLWLIYAMAAIGFYWMFGLAGRFAFSQTAMMALGGYLTAWTGRTFETSFAINAAVGVAGCAVVAAALGVAMRKAQLFYFAIGTLAVGQILFHIFRTAESFTGPNGTVTGVSPVELAGKTFVTDAELFWVLLGALSVILLLGTFIERSPLRRDAIAGRDNLMVARASGVAAIRLQVALFVAGSCVAGLAGAFIASSTGVVSIETFGFELAIGIFLMLFLGGTGSVWGAVLGAALYVALPQLLSGIEIYATIVYAVLLLVVILVLPNGLVGVAQGLGRWASNRLHPPRQAS